MGASLPPLIATAFDLRLVSREQIVRLADKAIIELPKPPEWLLELSCAPAEISPYDLGRLLPREREATDEELLALLAYGWKHRLLDPRKIGRLLYDKFCLSSWTEMTPLRQAIYVYDDELDWNASRAEETLWGILKSHITAGEELMAPMKNAEPAPEPTAPAAVAHLEPSAEMQLSSSGTSFYKIVFPAIWLTGFGAGAIAVAAGAEAPPPSLQTRIMFPIAWLFGFGLCAWLCFPLKHVTLGTFSITVQGLRKKIEIPLADIKAVRGSVFTKPEIITLKLKRPSEFGSSIRFTPSMRFWRVSPHPTVTLLSEKLARLRQ